VDLVGLLERAAQFALDSRPELGLMDVSLVLSDDAQLHELNRQYLGVDAPTDVLAFPGGDTDPDSQTIYLGDVILSYPRAAAQAAAGAHSVEAELQLLVVHGMLHLLGWDHTNEPSRQAMWAEQAEILRQLGCPITGPAPEGPGG
jgi:probable rRNA maturation factor